MVITVAYPKPDHMRNIKLCAILPLILIFSNAIGQIYGRIGYNAGGIITPQFNDVVDIYNENRPYLDNQMNHVVLLHGAVFGIGYHFQGSNVSNEFTWSNHHAVISSGGIDPNTNEYTTRDVKYRHNCLTYGVHFRIKKFPILWWGLSVDIDNYRQFTRINDDKYSWLDKSVIVADKIYVIFDLPISDAISVQFQPYFQLPWWIAVEYDQFVDLALNVPYWDGYSLTSFPKNYGLFVTFRFGGNNYGDN